MASGDKVGSPLPVINAVTAPDFSARRHAMSKFRLLIVSTSPCIGVILATQNGHLALQLLAPAMTDNVFIFFIMLLKIGVQNREPTLHTLGEKTTESRLFRRCAAYAGERRRQQLYQSPQLRLYQSVWRYLGWLDRLQYP